MGAILKKRFRQRSQWNDHLYESLEKNRDAKDGLIAWLSIARKATWCRPHEVQKDLVQIRCDRRMVFNVKENKYRLILGYSFQYNYMVRPCGSYAEFDKIDVLIRKLNVKRQGSLRFFQS